MPILPRTSCCSAADPVLRRPGPPPGFRPGQLGLLIDFPPFEPPSWMEQEWNRYETTFILPSGSNTSAPSSESDSSVDVISVGGIITSLDGH